MRTTRSAHPALSRLSPGDELAGALFAESLRPLDVEQADVLARLDNGEPIVTATRYGGGGAILVGSFLGLASHKWPHPENRRFLLSILEWAGIDHPLHRAFEDRGSNPIKLYLQRSDVGSVLVVINNGERDEIAVVDLQVDRDGPYEIHDVTADARSRKTADSGVLSLEITVSGRDAKVLSITHGAPS